MKALRVWLLCVSFVTLLACNKTNNTVVATPKITITGCVASPDSLSVQDNNPVSWAATDVDYLVTFVPTSTPSGPTIPVPSTSNPFQVKAGTTVTIIMHGPSSCSSVGCFYKYNLNRMNGTVPVNPPCIDPSIRILPRAAGGGN